MADKPYKVAVCSLFRDAITFRGEPNGTIPRVFRLLAQQTLPAENTFYAFLEGDSKDGTYEALQKWTAGHDNCCLLQQHTGEDEEGSRRRNSRFIRLASLANPLLDVACKQAEYVCWIEPDLLFEPSLFERLVLDLDQNPDWGGVAPFCRFGDSSVCYDIWGFRDPGNKQWQNNPPYSPRYAVDAVLEMHSVGSCLMMRSAVLEDGARMGEYAIVTLCEEIRARGYKVIADCRLEIKHPKTRRVGWKWML